LKTLVLQLLRMLKFDPQHPLLFNSGFFLIFLFVFLVGFAMVRNRQSLKVYFTIGFSLYFLYKVCGQYAIILVLAALFNFCSALLVHQSTSVRRKNTLLFVSIVFQLALLCFFKYFNLILIAGISFYTFENLSYLIDVYKGTFRPIRSFKDYLLFVSFFPKLIMGPIVRAKDFIPQIYIKPRLSHTTFGQGLNLILMGLVKKIIISDFINLHLVQFVFDSPLKYSGIECLFAAYGYAMVIYCDFSGYSDIAIGIAKWIGFEIPQNFNHPYTSKSFSEFWKRWHISLSSWLRDYLYIPLGGNRNGRLKNYINLLITMVLGGIWHGANMKYLLWGFIHGTLLVLEKLFTFLCGNRKFAGPQVVYNFIRGLIVFHVVTLLWVIFRSESIESALSLIHQIMEGFSLQIIPLFIDQYAVVLTLLAIGLLLHFAPLKTTQFWEELVIELPFVGKMGLTFIILYLCYQFKQSALVMPIYLQF